MVAETRLPNYGEVVAVSTSAMHSLQLTSYGAVYSWGDGECGKLGHGNEEQQRLLLQLLRRDLPERKTVSIATGQQHSLVLSDHGVVYSFGSGFSGKLGHGTQASHSLPRPIAALRGARHRDRRGHDALAVCTESGALYTFGYGLANQLGHGGKQNELAPRRVEAPAGVRIVLAAGGEHHSLVIDDAGAVYSFGAGEAAAGRRTAGSGPARPRHADEVPLPRKIAAPAGCRAGCRRREPPLARPRRGWRPERRRLLVWRRGRRQAGHGDARSQWTPKRSRASPASRPVDRRRRGALGLRDRLSFYAWGSLATGLREAETEAFPAGARQRGELRVGAVRRAARAQAHAPKRVEGFYEPRDARVTSS